MNRAPVSAEPTPLQTLILWALAVLGGTAMLSTLRPALKKPDRDFLAHAGLLRAAKLGRALRVELTDRGWAWVASHTTAALPANTNSATAVLAGLLARLGAYMAAREVALADIILPTQAATSAPAADLAGRIRAAYLTESGGTVNRRVRLAAIRARLADIGRAELDAALMALAQTGAAELLPLDDPTEIGVADREAAVPVGIEVRHLLWLHR